MCSGDEAAAGRYKTLAEQKFQQSNLKAALKYACRAQSLRPDLDGVSEMVAAFKILQSASKSYSSSGSSGLRNFYKILSVEPFSHINSIKKRYKLLALTLHPDKNGCLGAEDAFKHVGEAFRVLSDKIRRKEYDTKLRIAMQSESETGTGSAGPVEMFWTECSACRLRHQFEWRYVRCRLICPNCKKGFLAVEIDDKKPKDKIPNGSFRENEESRVKVSVRASSRARLPDEKNRKIGLSKEEPKKRKARATVSPQNLSSKKVKRPKKEMTLAEFQREAKLKADIRKSNLSKKSKADKEKNKEKEAEEKAVVVKNDDAMCMIVEDSDFYNFDKDRMERSFKKGQIWAIYDDDDGMPRHYGLVDEVISLQPFRIKMSWLDVQNNGDEALISWENLGFHISCGKFKVGRKLDVDSVNMFSHVVNCERAAKEIYRIYPKKGSVWALYRGDDGAGKGDGERCYDIVVFLTSYSEMHGLSMAYLDKVEGFKTIFTRREIGCQAITWLEKDDVKLFSHQIPSRKLSGEEAPGLPRESWELDPASLPPDLLRIDIV